MFRTVTQDLVKALCGGAGCSSAPGSTVNTSIGLGQSVIPASSVNEASQVTVGTFAIKINPSHFWQTPSVEFLAPITVSLDRSKEVSSECTVVNDVKKEIDMSENNSVNVSAIKEIGANAGMKGSFKMHANLGPIKRRDLNRGAIDSFNVPVAVANQLKKPGGGRRQLAIVTKLFIISNEATISLDKELSTEVGADVSHGPGEVGGELSSGQDTSSSMTLIAGQVVAYSLQEVDFDPKTNSFSLPIYESSISADNKESTS